MDARSAREWSSEAAARDAQTACGGVVVLVRKPWIGWFVTLYRYVSNVCSIWDAKNTA